jgi:hypothetical protein
LSAYQSRIIGPGGADISPQMMISVHFEPWLVVLVLSMCAGFLRTRRR